ncbi:c-type cytochrome [Roseibium salinum]|nr:c-type cytochrome [Roseibium salinum]
MLLTPAMRQRVKKVFKKCAACHAVGEGAQNKVGPHLNDILGRTAGTGEDFKYSKPMIDAGKAGLVWDEASLTTYLEKAAGHDQRHENGLRRPAQTGRP